MLHRAFTIPALLLSLVLATSEVIVRRDPAPGGA
jgi:hypothetical protein